ncbi:MAG TPA: hypothetical protein VLK82_24805 [Candidatus Tectomicrobia bacterium]|nr:hypothetical protein [Candidatus Tectomicrobia bacterium]
MQQRWGETIALCESWEDVLEAVRRARQHVKVRDLRGHHRGPDTAGVRQAARDAGVALRLEVRIDDWQKVLERALSNREGGHRARDRDRPPRPRMSRAGPERDGEQVVQVTPGRVPAAPSTAA